MHLEPELAVSSIAVLDLEVAHSGSPFLDEGDVLCIEGALAFEELAGESIERFEKEIVEVREVVPQQAMVDTCFRRDNSHGERGVATLNEQPLGGGGNFGVVTSFEFQLHGVGPEVLSGLIVHDASDAEAALEFYREFAAQAPDALTTWVVMRKAPPLPFLDEATHGTDVVVFALMYNGDASEGEAVIAPLRAFGTPVGEHVGLNPYVGWQQAFDPLLTPGARNYWKSHNFGELSDDTVATLIRYAQNLPSGFSEIFIAQVGGATSSVASDATAYVGRDAGFVLNVHTRWEDAADDERCVAWAREFFDATLPFAIGGAYVNFMTAEESGRVEAAYGQNHERLVAVKDEYDRNNLFRFNQNIAPSGG